jgi:hypothetical protein
MSCTQQPNKTNDITRPPFDETPRPKADPYISQGPSIQGPYSGQLMCSLLKTESCRLNHQALRIVGAGIQRRRWWTHSEWQPVAVASLYFLFLFLSSLPACSLFILA